MASVRSLLVFAHAAAGGSLTFLIPLCPVFARRSCWKVESLVISLLPATAWLDLPAHHSDAGLAFLPHNPYAHLASVQPHRGFPFSPPPPTPGVREPPLQKRAPLANKKRGCGRGWKKAIGGRKCVRRKGWLCRRGRAGIEQTWRMASAFYLRVPSPLPGSNSAGVCKNIPALSPSP